MTTTIQKWGNSCAVRLPQEMLRKFNLQAGHEVEILDNGKGALSIVRVPQRERSLSELVARITQDNVHAAIDWGKPRGNEIW